MTKIQPTLSQHRFGMPGRQVISVLVACLALASARAQVLQLQPLSGFGTNGNGTILPGQRPYLTDGTTNTGTTTHELQRSMAYNPATGHLLVLSRTNVLTGESPYCAIIDAVTGADVGSLAFGTPGIGANSGFDFNVIAIAADGGIYIGDQTSASQSGGSSPGSFNLYYWADESSSMVELTGGGSGFNGDPSNGNTSSSGNGRWGDSMAVTGSGTNTQVLLSSRGNVFAILTPTDPTLTQPWSVTTLTTTVPAGNIGYGLAFGAAPNTFYAQTEGGPLYLFSYDFTNAVGGTATVLETYSTSVFPGQTGAIGVQPTNGLLANLEMPAETGTNPVAANVRLYNAANTANPPALLDREAWATNETQDGVLAGSIFFVGTNLYALESDNGIMAFSVFSGPQPSFAPAIFLEPGNATAYFQNNATFSAAADGYPATAYQWYFANAAIAKATNAVLTVSNIAPANLGQYYVVATNSAGYATSSLAILSEAVAFHNGVVYEPFNYPVGSPLQGLGGWVTNSAAAAGIQALCYIAAGNLAAPGLAPPAGNHYFWSSNLTARLPFGTQTNGPLYFSFTERATNQLPNLTTEDAFAGLAYFSSTTLFPKIDCIWTDNNHYQLGIAKGTGTTHIVTNATVFTSSDVVFVVACLVMTNNNTGSDIIEMWVNPDPTTFGAANPPPPNCITNVGSGDPTTGIDRFSCRGITDTVAHEIDELRVGFTWAAVTAPLPVYLTAGLSGDNVVVSWPTNGVGYTLISNTSLTGGSWSTNTPISVQGTNYIFTTPVSAGSQFFRLIR